VFTTVPPIQYIATNDDDIARLRAEIFRGQLDDSVLCEVMGWSTRTLQRQIANGLPHYKLGSRRLFDIDAVRYWIVSRQEIKNAPARKRGRPRLTAGADHPQRRRHISQE
jgi:hypothetical protein